LVTHSEDYLRRHNLNRALICEDESCASTRRFHRAVGGI
jgi:hypothetical protein